MQTHTTQIRQVRGEYNTWQAYCLTCNWSSYRKGYHKAAVACTYHKNSAESDDNRS